MGMRQLILLCAVALCGVCISATIDDRCGAMLESWRERLRQEKLNYIVAPPFVIAGDGSEAQLAGYRDRSIVSAKRAMEAMYFEKKLDEPVLILLFESAGPYKGFAKRHLNDDDVPHYGFFRQRDGLMVMNVSTGTGTLVHELAHALIRPDFPEVPDWFNEGFASLFERCSINNDTIRGLPNWRLAGLQKTIRAGKLRPLTEMMADEDFYGEALVGVNYAQARYLMLYLQEHGLLQKYYKTFRDAVEEDATGVKALKKTLGREDLEAFDQEWRAWVLGLRFGGE
jgi:hypothetical protein